MSLDARLGLGEELGGHPAARDRRQPARARDHRPGRRAGTPRPRRGQPDRRHRGADDGARDLRRRGRPERPLTFLVGALTPVLEGLLVVLVVSGVLMGSLLPPSTAIGGVVSPASIAIIVVWLVGVYVINRVRQRSALERLDAGRQPGRAHRRAARIPSSRTRSPRARPRASRRCSRVACAVTLVAGVLLELAGNTLADRAGINGVIFGATALAVATRPARDQLRHRRRAARRQRARARRHLRRQRLPGLPVPARRPDRGLGRCCRRLVASTAGSRRSASR